MTTKNTTRSGVSGRPRPGTGHRSGSSRGSRSRRRARNRRRLWWGVGGVAVILIASAVWVGVRGMLAKAELEAAVPLARTAQEQVIAGDADEATTTAGRLSKHAAAAAGLTSDPVWRAAELVPWVGPNLEGMRVIAASVDRVAAGAVTPLAEAAASIDLAAFSPSGGRLDLEPMRAMEEPVHEAAVAMNQARAMMLDERIASADLIGPLAEARNELTGLLDEAGGAVDALDRAVRLVPAMLGVDGPRDVLLLFQNNAELRSTGGVSGALALLRTDGGAFELTRQADTQDFPKFEQPVAELPVETRALYGDNTASYIQDVNFTPQFPLAASLAREMWKQRFGEEVQSVIALDPVVLSHLLVATGPIALPSGDVLSSDNAVQLLLSDVYARYTEPEQQDQFFAEATAAVIHAISGDRLEPRALIRALVESGAERRLLIWNADPAEQAILAGTTLVGGLPERTPNTEVFGVYLNDRTGAKMGTYLDIDVAAGAVTCRADGRSVYQVEVTLTNTAPPDAGSILPPYVRGIGSYGTPPGEISTSIAVYGAPGNYNLGVRRDGAETPYHPTSDSGYTLSKVDTRLSPGMAETYTFAFLGGTPGKRAVEVRTTPSIHAIETSPLPLACESAVW